MFTAPLSWSNDGIRCEGFASTPDEAERDFNDIIGCVRGNRIYIEATNAKDADEMMLSFCKFDSGFAKLNLGYTCIYRGGRRVIQTESAAYRALMHLRDEQ